MSGLADVPVVAAPTVAFDGDPDDAADKAQSLPGIVDSGGKKRTRRKPDHPEQFRPRPADAADADLRKKPRAAGDAPVVDASRSDPRPLPAAGAPVADASPPLMTSGLIAIQSAASLVPPTYIGFGPEAPPAPLPAALLQQQLQHPRAQGQVGRTEHHSPSSLAASGSKAVTSPPPSPLRQSAVAMPSETAGAAATGPSGTAASGPSATGPVPKGSISYYFKGGIGSGAAAASAGAQAPSRVSPDAAGVSAAAAAAAPSAGGRLRGGPRPPGEPALDGPAPPVPLDIPPEQQHQQLSVRLLAAEAECQRLQANVQSMKTALKEAADTVRVARTEAAEARAAAQAELDERNADRARAAAEEKEAQARREAAQATLARFVRRAAQADAIVRLDELNAKTVRGRLSGGVTCSLTRP